MAYTVQDMHQQFKDELDKVDSLAVPNYLSTEIDRLLNDAQEKFIKERLPQSRTKKTTVEETQRRRDDLSVLTTPFSTTTFVTNANNKPNGVFVTLPVDYKYMLDQSVDVTYTNECGETVNEAGEIFQITHNEYAPAVRDPFNRPEAGEVLQLPFGNITVNTNLNSQTAKVIELVTDADTDITRYSMRYLKEPVKIQLSPTPTTCELGETQAREIVSMAVADVLKIISDPRYQLQKSELVVTE